MSSSSLRDDLASLKIERAAADRPSTRDRAPSDDRGRPRRGGGSGSGLRLLSLLVWLIPIGILAGAGTVGYLQYEKIRPKTAVTVGSVQAMTTGEAETLLSAKGYIMAVNRASIGAKMPGRVERMLVKEGDRVKGPVLDADGNVVTPGQALAVLEHDDILAQLDSKLAMLDRTRAELSEAQIDRDFKKTKYERRAQLQSRGTVTGEEMEQYASDYRMAENRITALQAAQRMQQAMIRETKILIDDMTLRAPFDGTITEKGADVGETILIGGMGAASGRGSVATLADLANLEVETDIAENLLSRVTVGQPAEISVSAVPQHKYRGKLTRVIPMGDRTRATVKVRVQVLDPDDQLFPDLAATVHFLPDKALENPNAGKSFLFVPKAAVVEENGFQYAWVLAPNGAVSRKKIDVVVSGDDLARVEKGLEPGAKVVLNPPKSLTQGQIVTLAE
jgi:RND family efflux transporter MFP subunit